MGDRRGRVTHRASLKEENITDQDRGEAGGDIHKNRNGKSVCVCRRPYAWTCLNM